MEITVEMVERLREKAPVSYAQAKEALEYSEGNLLDALIYLEEKGAIPQAEGTRWSGREEKESQPTAAELVVQETPEPGKKKKHRSPLGVVVVWPKGEKRRGRSLRELLSRGGPVGRKLDFLIQEFNREANTIGSKCSDLDIARQVVDIKAEIEKIREQVQNIE